MPSSSGIFRGGNHKSHCAASPGAQVSRSAGSTGRCSGRNRFTFSLNHRIEPAHPTRSATTVAGMSGVCSSSARTRGSNTANDVGPGDRSYLGGASEFTALITVVREIPNRSAIRVFGTPSAASLLISAQSSKVITLQSLSVHFSPPKLFSFRAPPIRAVRRGGRQTAVVGGIQRRPTHAVCPPARGTLYETASSGGCYGTPTAGIRRWSRTAGSCAAAGWGCGTRQGLERRGLRLGLGAMRVSRCHGTRVDPSGLVVRSTD